MPFSLHTKKCFHHFFSDLVLRPCSTHLPVQWAGGLRRPTLEEAENGNDPLPRCIFCASTVLSSFFVRKSRSVRLRSLAAVFNGTLTGEGRMDRVRKKEGGRKNIGGVWTKVLFLSCTYVENSCIEKINCSNRLSKRLAILSKRVFAPAKGVKNNQIRSSSHRLRVQQPFSFLPTVRIDTWTGIWFNPWFTFVSHGIYTVRGETATSVEEREREREREGSLGFSVRSLQTLEEDWRER